jgi:hypothetical protein
VWRRCQDDADSRRNRRPLTSLRRFRRRVRSPLFGDHLHGRRAWHRLHHDRRGPRRCRLSGCRFGRRSRLRWRGCLSLSRIGAGGGGGAAFAWAGIGACECRLLDRDRCWRQACALLEQVRASAALPLPVQAAVLPALALGRLRLRRLQVEALRSPSRQASGGFSCRSPCRTARRRAPAPPAAAAGQARAVSAVAGLDRRRSVAVPLIVGAGPDNTAFAGSVETSMLTL